MGFNNWMSYGDIYWGDIDLAWGSWDQVGGVWALQDISGLDPTPKVSLLESSKASSHLL